QLGPDLLAWWPAGSQLTCLLGPRYAVIGSAIGISDFDGLGQPESGTLEARLAAAGSPEIFIPTYKGAGLPATEIACPPTRASSTKNSTYFPLTPQSISDFDWLVLLNSTADRPAAQYPANSPDMSPRNLLSAIPKAMLTGSIAASSWIAVRFQPLRWR